jgi:hypothetical protein
MLAQAVTDQGSDSIAWIGLGIWGVLLLVGIMAIVKFFQMAADVRSILNILEASSEAQHGD